MRWPSHSIFTCFSMRSENTHLPKDLRINSHRRFIYDSQNLSREKETERSAYHTRHSQHRLQVRFTSIPYGMGNKRPDKRDRILHNSIWINLENDTANLSQPLATYIRWAWNLTCLNWEIDVLVIFYCGQKTRTNSIYGRKKGYFGLWPWRKRPIMA